MPPTSSLIRETFPELEEIRSAETRAQVENAWSSALAGAGRSDFTDTRLLVPEGTDEVGILHQRGTVRLAAAIADILIDSHDAPLSRDHVVAGAFLHDIGKLAAASSQPASAPRHPFYGVHSALSAGLPAEVAHIVAAHSLEGVYAEKSLATHVVSAADMLSADTLLRVHLGTTVFKWKRAIYMP